MVTITPMETSTICDHPYWFCIVMLVLAVSLGFWLGRQWNHWMLERLETRNDLLKMELDALSPRRAKYL